MEQILRYYRQDLSRLTLLCGEGGGPGSSVRLRERIVPELMDDLQIPPEDQEGIAFWTSSSAVCFPF